MKEHYQGMTWVNEGNGGWMDGQKKKEKDEESPRSQKNTNTSPARRSPTITSSGRTTRILPTPTGGMCTPALPSAPPLLPIPVPARATRAAANANALGTHDGDGVAGPAEYVESAGDGGVAQPRGANVRAVGSRRRSGGSAGEDVSTGAGEGVNAGAAGLSFVFAQRAVKVVASTGTEDSVSVLLPVSVAALDGLCRCRCKAAEILRVILLHVHADGPHCTTANTASATGTTKRVARRLRVLFLTR